MRREISGQVVSASGYIMRLVGVALLIGAAGSCLAAEDIGPTVPKVAVEGQPLAANARRLMSALSSLGTPVPSKVRQPLERAIDSLDAALIQQILDPNVLLVVEINPEERVKVSRGPATAVLQQFGFTPVLVKVLNASTATRRLRLTSPQSGAVYAGVAKLSMERQQSMELIENENKRQEKGRFLAVEMANQPPMTDRLSGLEVEYATALILSTEAGQREVTIGFDLGQGEQDLGFRGEVPILFKVKPAIPVRLSIRDEDGTPTTAALLIRDRQGHVLPPQAKRLAPDFFFQPQIYRAHGESILLPPGDFTIQTGRGPEYWNRELMLHLDEPTPDPLTKKSAEPNLTVQLSRWVHPQQFGFFSGDHHIHAAGCAHYTQPTEGVLPEDMFRQVKGEGMNVGCVLTWGPCYRHQRQFFAAKPHDVSEQLTLLKYDLEISGFGSQALGHVCLLNLQDQTYPGSEGTETKGWPTWTTPVMRWAKAQGGVTGYAHSASGIAIEPAPAAKRLLSQYDRDANQHLSRMEASSALLPEPFEEIDKDQDQQLDEAELKASHERAADRLPNHAIPEMNGVGAMEICVTTAEGVCDFISAMDTRRIQEWNMWYHILNCGFPLKVSGETDFPCMSSRRVGQGRVYVQLAHPNADQDPIKKLDFTDWCRALAQGRSYVSDGFAHALDFSVNEIHPGFGEVNLTAKGTVNVRATVCFAPETPVSIAQGTHIPAAGAELVGDTVDLHGPRLEQLQPGGKRLVEIVMNGNVVATQTVPADGAKHQLQFEVAVDRSSWLTLRQFPQLHTNPVNVIVAGKPIRASKSSARWCELTIEQLWRNREQNISKPERDEARQTFDRAKEKFREIARQCELE